MQETLMILSESDEINNLLYKPIVTTQRIKYTCLNVSAYYIVLGATSGSLYLFVRESCSFQQLIPLSEGPVSCVVISPDEKTVALATRRGTVCLVALKPAVKLLAVSSEHLGELVTSLCWNDNSSEIYVGDGIGKISTMVLSIFTVNGMFQPPSCALMHLDSTIVQMDFSGHLLLVSTMTRCYICDTSQEHFKQIGNKARDGEFGACFLDKRSVEREKIPSRSPETEEDASGRKSTSNSTSDSNGEMRENLTSKIYCARPGCRLWEVNANGIVVKTHQFKEALSIPPAAIYRSNSTRSTLNRPIEQSSMPHTPNFSRLHSLSGKYLFSHTSNGIYIIDPSNAAVVLWTNDYFDISMARTFNDRIYLMTDKGTFHCLTLSTTESLILRLYDKKRYKECMRACSVLRPELLKSIGIANTSRDHVIIDDTDNPQVAASNELTSALVPLISLIQSNVSAKPVKLNSGIVVVNAGNGKFRNDEIRSIAKSTISNSVDDLDNFREAKNYDEDGGAIAEAEPVLFENFVKKRERSRPMEDGEKIDIEAFAGSMSELALNENSSETEARNDPGTNVGNEGNSRKIDDLSLSVQTDLNPVYVAINSLKPSMSDGEIEGALVSVRKTMHEINENYGKIDELKDFLYEVLRATERHCYNVLLENTSTELLRETTNVFVVNEVVRAFVDVNSSVVDECGCGYTYPRENVDEPKFLDIGRSLVERFSDADVDDCTKLCNSVPFMWRVSLPIFVRKNSVTDDMLSMCLRSRDNIVLSIVLPAIDARQWGVVVKCLRDLEDRVCPSCGERDDNSNARRKRKIEWSDVAREIMKRDGATSALEFLELVENVFPNVILDRSIFQSIIFTKILNHHGVQQSVDFSRKRMGANEYEAMCSPKVQEQLAEALEKDLERPIPRNIFGTGSHHWGMQFQTKSSTCPCCTLSLQTPVLLGDNGISLFPCGHAYHVNCLIQRKLTRCNLH